MTANRLIRMSNGRVHRTHVDLLISHLVKSIPLDHEPTNFRLDDRNFNKDQYEFLSSASSIASTDSGLSLVEEANAYAVLDHKVESIVYLMEYQYQVISRRDCATQYKLWHDKSQPTERVNGVPVQAFVFGLLLDNFDAVVTDKYQTQDGKKFWFNQIARAFNNGLFVYSIELNNIVHLPTKKEFDILRGHIWGDKPEHYNRRVAISKKKVW